MKISFFGPEATFTHLAAIKHFGEKNFFVAKKSIAEVFESVEKKETKFGVVPVENSTEGSVAHTLDSLLDSDLKIVAEVVLPIKQCLLSNSKRSELKKIFSHPQALGQCRKYLSQNFPNAEIIESSSTAKAAQQASIENGSAAIASELASKMFSIKILEKGINDENQNQTRFFVVGKESLPFAEKSKTTIVFSTNNISGALYAVLGVLAKHKINMTKIESRPSKKKVWAVVFFVDFEGNINDAKVSEMLKEVIKHCQFVKVLGSYPEKLAISD
jgi:chorismate mutase / prephenate dehydratase